MRMTKQGVRNLNPPGASPNKHTHRFAPVTYTNRQGFQVTQMKCYCDDVKQETDAEKRAREDAEERARYDREEREMYG